MQSFGRINQVTIKEISGRFPEKVSLSAHLAKLFSPWLEYIMILQMKTTM